MKQNIQDLEIPHCIVPQCNGVVKPDIVFFGESLPTRFFQGLPNVVEADLAIIMGTSLTVMPFSALPSRIRDEIPRVLINRERVGGLGGRLDDVLLLDDCDTGVRKLAKHLGWAEELENLWAQTDLNRKLDKGKAKQEAYDGPMDMDEVLREQVASLTRDVEKSLSLADNHKQRVGNQLKAEQEKRNQIEGEGKEKPLELASTEGERELNTVLIGSTMPPKLEETAGTGGADVGQREAQDKGKGKATGEGASHVKPDTTDNR